MHGMSMFQFYLGCRRLVGGIRYLTKPSGTVRFRHSYEYTFRSAFCILSKMSLSNSIFRVLYLLVSICLWRRFWLRMQHRVHHFTILPSFPHSFSGEFEAGGVGSIWRIYMRIPTHLKD